jgi:DNA primase
MWINYRALRNRVPVKRVLDLINYHPTSRRRHRHRGACAFHAPERPLPHCFSVEPTRGLARGFICGAQGNQLDLLALHEATLDLCEHAEVRIPVTNSDSTAQ